MIIGIRVKPVPIYLALGGMSAILPGLITSPRNATGWALLLWGTGLLAASLGPFQSLRHPEGVFRRKETRKNRLLLAGILAASIIPPLEFLYFPAILPRSQWMQDTGLNLCALGLLFPLRSIISWECWIREEVPEPGIRRELERVTNPPISLLGLAGIALWALGVCAGFGSILGSAAVLLLFIPGLIPQEF